MNNPHKYGATIGKERYGVETFKENYELDVMERQTEKIQNM
jgi:hypothetical protein